MPTALTACSARWRADVTGARCLSSSAGRGSRIEEETGPLATGRVDLVHRDGNELVVIDYKTDKDVTVETAEAHALEKHSGQAEIYSQALSRRHRSAVREVVFVYCKAGVEVSLRERMV